MKKHAETTQENLDQIQLDGIDLSELSLEGLEITALGDAMNVPEMGASSGVSSCNSCSCCVSTSCCSIGAEQPAETVEKGQLEQAPAPQAPSGQL